MNDTVLSLEGGIEKVYNPPGQPGEVAVLRGASLSLARGEVVALVAPPSGAGGKSTLLHIAGGLLDTADAGQVAIAGQDMTHKSDRRRTAVRREEVGFVYQFHHLLPEFTAAENVVLPQLANGVGGQGEANTRALDLLGGRVDVAKRATHRPAELSGGEQQRVASAVHLPTSPRCCWRMNPPEPGSRDLRHRVRSLMELVRDTGLSALIATHNLELAARMDRVLRLENGGVITEGG